jgi:hypothetical protein
MMRAFILTQFLSKAAGRCLSIAIVTALTQLPVRGYAAPEAPIADAATAKAFNTNLIGQTLRQTAEQAKDDVVVRRGVGVEDPAAEVAYSLGGATPEAGELREKTCAADLVAVARPRSEYRAVFSEDGSSIFTLRRFHVERVLRRSSAVPDFRDCGWSARYSPQK